MPFPNCSFGKEVDPSEAGKKSALHRGDRYKFLRQTRCNDLCPYYFKGCIYISLSKTPQYGGKCAVKNLPDRQKERVVRFLEGKAEDYVANMVELYQEIENSVKLRKDPSLMMQAFDRLQRLYTMFHGDKQITTDEGLDMKDLFDKMGEQLKELERQNKEEKPNIKEDQSEEFKPKKKRSKKK